MGNIDIKDIWKNQPTKDLSDMELDRIRLQKSESFLDKLKKNARIENGMNILVASIFSVYILVNSELWIGLTSSLGMAIFTFYYYTLYKEIWKLEPTGDVRGFLELVLEKMKFFLNRYYIGIVIVMPIAFWFGLNIGSQSNEQILDKLLTVKGIIIISVALILTILFTFWVIHLMYGKTVNKLKEMLKGLDENQ